MYHSITSPFLRKSGGLLANIATPGGVPIIARVPAGIVVPWLRKHIKFYTPKIISDVLEL